MSAAVIALPGAQEVPVIQSRKRGPFPGVVKLAEVRATKKRRERERKSLEGLRIKLVVALGGIDSTISMLEA